MIEILNIEDIQIEKFEEINCLIKNINFGWKCYYDYEEQEI